MMKVLPTNEFARYAAWMARMARIGPRVHKVSFGGKGNQEQECARRRRFFERHGTAIGGGPIWP